MLLAGVSVVHTQTGPKCVHCARNRPAAMKRSTPTCRVSWNLTRERTDRVAVHGAALNSSM
jgi:hypothetical protein